MSYTTIIHVFPGDKIECGKELKNSWGSAPYVWDALIKKHIGAELNMMYREANELWDMWKRSDIPIHHRAPLMLTYDRVYVSKANYARMAEDIRKFLTEFDIPNVVNHWPAIAEFLESDPYIPGIGLWCTSVSENPFNGPWDEEKEKYLDPDWENIFEVYEQLDNFGGES